LYRRDDKTKDALSLYEKLMKEFPDAAKATGLGDRALAFASGEGISDLPPALAAYKDEVEAAQLAAAVAKAAALPPANVRPEATSADQAAVLKAATPRPSISDTASPANTNTPTPPQVPVPPPSTSTNTSH
ncbi:MAG: hypothetical protein NTZ01_03470, partial [Verrucomicrobia bacterium]|nr:hypothetical protein [Verrucomicrobiota bacterium]